MNIKLKVNMMCHCRHYSHLILSLLQCSLFVFVEQTKNRANKIIARNPKIRKKKINKNEIIFIKKYSFIFKLIQGAVQTRRKG